MSALGGLLRSLFAAFLVVAVMIAMRVSGGIEWGSPVALLLLIPVLLLPAQRRLTGRHALAVARVDKKAVRASPRTLVAWLPDALLQTGLALAVLALARPQITHKDTMVESNGLDIMLALDTSGSMRTADMAMSRGYATRIDVAKGVVARFVDARPYDRIGLVVFGEQAFTHVPLTLDHQSLDDVIQTVDIGVAGPRGTAIGTALAVASKRLEKLQSKEKLIILLTDGRSNAGSVQPIEAAQAAKALGIRIYTIGVGGNGGSGGLFGFMTSPDDGVDEQGLQQIADTTGGQYFRATDAASLEDIYDRIDKLEKTTAKVKQLVSHEEMFRRLLVPALALIGTATALSATLLRRSP